VQIPGEPFGPLVDKIRERLSFLGEPKRSPKAHNFTLYFRFESEFSPVVNLRLKVETNTREHFTVLGLQQFPFEVTSSWFERTCHLTTYRIEELLGTKLRALYQRRKGRDLYDLFIALTKKPGMDIDAVLHSYREYMKFSVEKPPNQWEYILNMEAKMLDSEFLGDTTGLLRPDVPYDPQVAYDLVKTKLIERI
jgi:predicted nucleotidyltransferase component of viral defense system